MSLLQCDCINVLFYFMISFISKIILEANKVADAYVVESALSNFKYSHHRETIYHTSDVFGKKKTQKDSHHQESLIRNSWYMV